jgi:serine/threonine protein kinase
MHEEDISLRFRNLVHTDEDPSDLFEILDPIGEGSYGFVYKGIIKSTAEPVAIKLVPLTGGGTDIISLFKEMEILGECKSPYVVSYYGAYYKRDHLWLVLEYCEAGSVNDIINITERPFNESEIASILDSVLKGLSYMHKKKMIHRDIKGANILVDGQGNVKISDFGVIPLFTRSLLSWQLLLVTRTHSSEHLFG